MWSLKLGRFRLESRNKYAEYGILDGSFCVNGFGLGSKIVYYAPKEDKTCDSPYLV